MYQKQQHNIQPCVVMANLTISLVYVNFLIHKRQHNAYVTSKVTKHVLHKLSLESQNSILVRLVSTKSQSANCQCKPHPLSVLHYMDDLQQFQCFVSLHE